MKKKYKLQVCIDNDVNRDDTIWVTIDTTMASSVKDARQQFQQKAPEIMSRFGNGRPVITPEVKRHDL